MRIFGVCSDCGVRVPRRSAHLCDPALLAEVAIARNLVRREITLSDPPRSDVFEADMNFFAQMMDRTHRLECPQCWVVAGKRCISTQHDDLEFEDIGRVRPGPHLARMIRAGWPLP